MVFDHSRIILLSLLMINKKVGASVRSKIASEVGWWVGVLVCGIYNVCTWADFSFRDVFYTLLLCGLLNVHPICRSSRLYLRDNRTITKNVMGLFLYDFEKKKYNKLSYVSDHTYVCFLNSNKLFAGIAPNDGSDPMYIVPPDWTKNVAPGCHAPFRDNAAILI